MPETSTRQRIIAAASRLFAERGYAKTSVADIQTAVGLTGGSGALYKHFRSKEELLRAVVDEHVAHYEAEKTLPFAASGEVHGLDDVSAVLERLGRVVLARLDLSVENIRITFRELDQFPELLEILHARLMRPLYAEVADWLAQQAAAGRVPAVDAQATSAVLVGSLTYYPIYRVLLGEPEAGVDQDRFLKAWVAVGTAALTA
ncbi:AcrR family transcriptional regulator [Hamadaea flava]|uniref:TetR family transcriptional regulator n=1 Tax=Hamadaea flava TaxID=1742688 RepID=A0ABV8LQ44_9ACTN|nr:TetR/AcrR family transcriptional regulator [Hamadaea flava]MCP2322967.1 AcrR family transcriptional regulator [Hamadaea flava]